MEFLLNFCSSTQNVPSEEELGETQLFSKATQDGKKIKFCVRAYRQSSNKTRPEDVSSIS